MKSNQVSRSFLRGATLIETCISLGIVAILIGLLLPAVQSSREQARRTQCAHHLAQILKAIHAFDATQGSLPPAARSHAIPPRANRAPTSIGIYSLQCLILPFLDQSPLFHSINFDDLSQLEPGAIHLVQATVARTVVGVYLCPSDPHQHIIAPFAPNSYRASRGTGGTAPRPSPVPGLPSLSHIRDGAFSLYDHEKPQFAQISDGLSSTIAFSEKPIGSFDGSYHPFRDWSFHPNSFFPIGFDNLTADDLIKECSSPISTDPRPPTWKSWTAGSSWMRPGPIFTQFFTAAPPNANVPDCMVALPPYVGVFSARSYHPGGVNAAMCDGSVRWFTSSTDRLIWRALGTRAGGEVITTASFP
jgi:prepilin-type processing-associated H-X9-DG protein